MIHVEQHGPVTAIRMSRSLVGRPLYWTAAYWVDGVLIDTGPASTASELVRVLRNVTVEQVVITHAHENNIGGLSAIKQAWPDAKIFASYRTIPLIEQPDELRLQLYRRLLWGLPQPVANVTAVDEVANIIQSDSYTLRVVETPGHSNDHISLFEPQHRWVFSGDAFIGGNDEAWTPDFNMFGIVSSLRTLESLHPERLFPGSGSVRRTPRPELHGKIGSLIRLCREVAKLEKIGLSVPEIAVCLFKEEPRISFWTQGHFSSANLIEACRSYNAIFAPTDSAWTDGYSDSADGNWRRPASGSATGDPADRSNPV